MPRHWSRFARCEQNSEDNNSEAASVHQGPRRQLVHSFTVKHNYRLSKGGFFPQFFRSSRREHTTSAQSYVKSTTAATAIHVFHVNERHRHARHSCTYSCGYAGREAAISALVPLERDHFVDRTYWQEVKILRDSFGQPDTLVYDHFEEKASSTP
jgi:hypothetical protein